MPSIRGCCSEDFTGIVELLRQHWPDEEVRETSLRGVFERGLASPRQRYICAELDSRVVGFGSLTLKNSLRQEGTVGHVDELVVDRDHRCRGIATLLMQRIAFHFKDAHAFYEQRRFERRALLFSKALPAKYRHV